MSLDQIVSLNIQAQTTTPSRANFGTPLCLAYHTRFAENSRDYRSAAEMIADGFTVNDPAYKLAAAVFSQNPRPATIRMGRLPAPSSAHVTTLDVNGIASGTITGTVTSPDGTATAISVAFDTSSGTTAAALATAVDAISGLSASASGDVVTCTADANGPVFFYDMSSNVNVRDKTADWGYDTQLGVLLLEASDFYAVFIDVNSDANIADVATWAAANKKIAGFSVQATDPADYATQGGALQSADNDRAFSLVTKRSQSEYPAAAWAGATLWRDPGSQTWAYKQLAGVRASNWSTTELNVIGAYGANHYTTIAGVSLTRTGVTHGGEYIDVTRGVDWLENEIGVDIATALINNAKIPYTDSGIQVIAAQVKGALLRAEARGILEPGSSVVTTQSVSEISASDRAARALTGVEFSARLAGAIHTVAITGTVTV